MGALGISSICFSQQKSIVGLNVTGEKTSFSDFELGIGGTFERQFKGHHGFETGIYYRSFDLHYGVFVNGSLYGYHNIKEEYLSVPVLYKFYSSLVNFSLGPTFDFYLGWKQINKGLTFDRDSHTSYDKFQVGITGKISKTINLTNHILLEPEIRYNPISTHGKSFYGIGIGFKYKLSN